MLLVCLYRVVQKSENRLLFYIEITANKIRLCLPWRLDLHQRPSSEEACSVLPVLATVVMRRSKKSVVCVAQCVAAIVRLVWCGGLYSLRPGDWQKYQIDQINGRAATHWATHTTDFLPRRITTVARIGRTEQASSNECLWWRSRRQGRQSLVVLAVIFI